MTLKQTLHRLQRQTAALSRSVAHLQSQTRAAGSRRAGKPADSAPAARLAGYLALAPTLADDAILQTLLRCAMHAVGGGGAALTLLDAQSRRLTVRAAVGDGAEGIIGQRVPLKGSRHGLAFATGEVQSATPLYSRVEKAAKARFRNVLVAPLIAEGEPVGTISAVNKRRGDHFGPEDMIAFRLFADVAAMVVRQRLREQILRDGLSAVRRRGSRLPAAFSAGDRELLRLFDRLAQLNQSHPEKLDALNRFVEALEKQ